MNAPLDVHGEGAATTETVVELLSEDFAIAKRRVLGETLRVETVTHAREHTIELPLEREIVEVERVVIGRVVDTAPGIRQEGDVTIIPVMEEEIVVQRRLVLKEEVRIRRVRTTQVHRETVQLRGQEAVVSRTQASDQPDSPADIHNPQTNERGST